jgi:UDP-2-acetamido-2-deoxy-ribo-hexuluronate aminotransferase
VNSVPDLLTLEASMQFIDLNAQQKRIRAGLEKNIATVLNHGQYIMGPEIQLLEQKLANYIDVNFAVACASGTDALLLALMAYDVGPGDAVFTTPFTFIATGEVISLLGATPVFVDIDRQTFNIDPAALERVIAAVGSENSDQHPLPRTDAAESLTPRGIIAVDLFGLPADYRRLQAVAEKNNLFIIEDAAQSFGAEFHGKKACALAEIGCTSFFPAKPLGCYGDGGMCFTDNQELAETMRSARVHGTGANKYDNVRIGINGRMDTIQAAILLAKFDIFPEEVELRQSVADRYRELLLNLDSITAPAVPQGVKSVWAQYAILARDENHRSRLQVGLKEAQIPTAIYYPKPLHLQIAYQSLGYLKGDFPVSEDCSQRILSLPMHPYLSPAAQAQIAHRIAQIPASESDPV